MARAGTAAYVAEMYAVLFTGYAKALIATPCSALRVRLA